MLVTLGEEIGAFCEVAVVDVGTEELDAAAALELRAVMEDDVLMFDEDEVLLESIPPMPVVFELDNVREDGVLMLDEDGVLLESIPK